MESNEHTIYLRPGRLAEYFEMDCIGYLIAEGQVPKNSYHNEENSVITEDIEPVGLEVEIDFQEMLKFDASDIFDENPIISNDISATQEGIFMQEKLLARMRDAGLVLVKSFETITSPEELYQLIDKQLHKQEVGCQIYLDDVSFDLGLDEISYIQVSDTCTDIYNEVFEEKTIANWSVFRPDLIRVTKIEEQRYKLEVIDIKASMQIRIEHKMQVAIYVYLLRRWLQSDEMILEDEVGYIHLVQDLEWKNVDEIKIGEAFDLSAPLNILENFLDHDLKSIAKFFESGKELPGYEEYVIGTTCQNCRCKNLCLNRAIEEADIRLIPGITRHAQRAWISLGLETSLLNERGLIKSFEEFVKYYGSYEKELCCNPFWEACIKGDQEIWQKEYEAYVHKLRASGNSSCVVDWNNIKKCNRASMNIPAQNDVAVFVHLKTSRSTNGEIFFSEYEIFTKIYNQPELVDDWGTSERRDISETSNVDCSEAFVNTLYELVFSLYKKREVYPFQVSFYTVSSTERNYLYTILYDAMEKEEKDLNYIKAQSLLRYFQGERYVLTDSHPGKLIHAPIVPVLEEIFYLYAIPSLLGISLNEVLRAFGLVEEGQSLSRLEKLELIIHTMQKWDSERLCAPYLKFDYPILNGIHNKYLSKMHYIQLNEKKHKYQPYLNALMGSTDEIIRSNQAIYLFAPEIWEDSTEKLIFRGIAYNKNNNQMFMPREPEQDEQVFSLRNLGQWIIIPDDNRILGLLRTSIIQGRDLQTSEMNLLFDASENGYYQLSIKGNESATYITFDSEGSLQINRFSENMDTVVDSISGFIALRPMQKDITADIMLEDIISIDRTLLDKQNELSWCPSYDSKEEQQIDEKRIRDEYGKLEVNGEETFFTNSQFEAFKQFYNHNITLLQGPPGTGKTDFIARSLITMARLHREKMAIGQATKALRVCISANSHAAINNVLNKVASYLDETFIKLVKGRNSGDETMDVFAEFSNLREYSKKTFLYTNSPKEVAMVVVGGTNWFFGTLNRCKIEDQFDYVIVDESSQMNSYQVLHLFANAKKDAKYMIVGDPLQLPSILQGSYAKHEEEIAINSSVYAMFDSLPGSNHYHKMIVEDFRMNRVLCDYVSRLYDRYTPFNINIEERSLMYRDEWDEFECNLSRSDEIDRLDNIFEAFLEGEKPLVICYISGKNALKKQECEVNLVKLITKFFYQLYKDDLPKRYSVIIPYHRHIEAVKEALIRDTEIAEELNPYHINFEGSMEAIPYEVLDELIIDTVDKLQGQEKDIVVCSYGIADAERITNEMEFVYSLNRLNVSLTRARKKCIVILSDTLATRPVEYLKFEQDDPRTKGVDFLCNLKDYMLFPFDEPAYGYREPYSVYLGDSEIECYSKSFDDVWEVWRNEKN